MWIKYGKFLKIGYLNFVHSNTDLLYDIVPFLLFWRNVFDSFPVNWTARYFKGGYSSIKCSKQSIKLNPRLFLETCTQWFRFIPIWDLLIKNLFHKIIYSALLIQLAYSNSHSHIEILKSDEAHVHLDWYLNTPNCFLNIWKS